MATVRCENCGAHIKLPETSSFGYGMSISKASSGNYVLPTEKTTEYSTENKEIRREVERMTRAEERIMKLRESGIDTSNYFAINEDTVIKMENGTPTVVPEIPLKNDPVVKQIIDDGDVFNSKLDGRWIMAQMFHMLDSRDGYTDALNKKGYNYQWDFLYNTKNGKKNGELYRMYKRQLTGDDYTDKIRWFNGLLLYKMICDYVVKLRMYVERDMKTYMLKGVLPYKRFGKRYEKLTGKAKGDIFVCDLHKLYNKYSRLAWRAYLTRTPKELFDVYIEFRKIMIKLPDRLEMCAEFKDAYKGNGAYYTASNLIRFHGCTIDDRTKAESLAVLNEKAREYENGNNGWKLLGFLKELIWQNDFDFNQRMAELNS